MKFRFAILGDIHYEKEYAPLIEQSLQQIIKLDPMFMISLGDVGGYSHCGTQLAFDEAKDIFSNLPFPTYPLIGNHDIEGIEFSTDKTNIEAWLKTFQKKSPYYHITINNIILAFLSSTSFRSNVFHCNEVIIDTQQIEWFEKLCLSNPEKSILVFSHAPILGSGIKVLQNLHLKDGNAYLNHSRNPEKFIQIVNICPNIKLWASAHIHLSQEYQDTISQRNNCVFMHTGVTSEVTRDGGRQSRVIEYQDDSINVFTIDHNANKLKLNATFDANMKTLQHMPYEPTNYINRYISPPAFEKANFIFKCEQSAFLVSENSLIEYDSRYGSPIGVIMNNIHPEIVIQQKDNVLQILSEDQIINTIEKNNRGYFSNLPIHTIQHHKLWSYIKDKNDK